MICADPHIVIRFVCPTTDVKVRSRTSKVNVVRPSVNFQEAVCQVTISCAACGKKHLIHLPAEWVSKLTP